MGNDWKPSVGDTVNIIKSENDSWLRKDKQIHGGTIIDSIEYDGLRLFRVQYISSWGNTSGWYQTHQMEKGFRVNCD